MRTLIAYFSREGNNYVNGAIVYLPVGNTQVVAEKIKTLTDGELFRIESVKAYSSDYTSCTKEAQADYRANARPALKADINNIAPYDAVILAYPNYWGTMPMSVWTFLDAHDFSGKTILPLCTHEGSGMGRSESDLKKLCPNARVLEGLAIQGGSVANADGSIRRWLEKNGVI
ncbi:MAG TPA: flavodoxin [Candidatus Limiplasma sp.]|mgnify:CR=1 FL=1|nr:flavodoxin [Candidatus Limiplasma sp.]